MRNIARHSIEVSDFNNQERKQVEWQKNIHLNHARTALVVGADHLGTIPVKLAKEGVQIIHWRGRNNSFKSKAIPADIDMVILYWDYINHPLMQNVKKQAKARGIPLIFNRCKSYRECFPGIQVL